MEEIKDYQDSFKVVKETLQKDSELYYVWQCGIAMSFYDAFNNHYKDIYQDGQYDRYPDLHEIANKAAKNFLNLLIKD